MILALEIVAYVLSVLIFGDILGVCLFKLGHSKEHAPWNWRLLIAVFSYSYWRWLDKHHPDWWRHP